MENTGSHPQTASVNNVQLKAAIRDVLNEPADNKRSRDDKEEDGGYEPARPLGSHPDDFEMDSDDSEKAARRNKKRGKK